MLCLANEDAPILSDSQSASLINEIGPLVFTIASRWNYANKQYPSAGETEDDFRKNNN